MTGGWGESKPSSCTANWIMHEAQRPPRPSAAMERPHVLQSVWFVKRRGRRGDAAAFLISLSQKLHWDPQRPYGRRYSILTLLSP